MHYNSIIIIIISSGRRGGGGGKGRREVYKLMSGAWRSGQGSIFTYSKFGGSEFEFPAKSYF